VPTAASILSETDEFVIRHIYALEDATIRALFEQYRIAYQRMKASLDAVWQRYVDGDVWTAEDAFFRSRTDTLLRQLEAEMAVLVQAIQELTLDAAEDSYRAGAVGKTYALDQAGLDDVTLPLLPAEAIRAQILAPYEGNTFVDRFLDNRADFERRIRRALVQSQIEGEGIHKAQERIAGELGIMLADVKAPGKKAHKQNFFRTQMIARTEILKASNLGALSIYRENTDSLKGYSWLAARDERVCPICAPLDGRMFDMSGSPIDGKGKASHALPPAHPQCRCTATPALHDEDLQRRIVGKRQTFQEWAEERGLTKNVYGRAFDFKGKDAPKAKKEA